MKIMCEYGPLAGERDFDDDQIVRGQEGREGFQVGADTYYRSNRWTKDPELPIFVWEPPYRAMKG